MKQTFLNKWNNYWFRPAPLLNLAIVRIILVGQQLYMMFSHWGQQKESFKLLSQMDPSLYWPLPFFRLFTLPLGWTYHPNYNVLVGAYCVAIIAGFFALIGFLTNYALGLFALVNMLLIAFAYSFGDIHHSEALTMIAFILLAASPSGRVLSLDDLLRRLSNAIRNRRFDKFNLASEESIYARWPLLTIQWMLALAYLSAAFFKFKLGGSEWLNGYTLQYYLLMDGTRWGSALGVFLSKQHIFCVALSYISVIFEATFFLAVLYPPVSWLYAAAGIGMHEGIFLAMRAPFFEFMGLYIAFFSWNAVSSLFLKCAPKSLFEKKGEVLFDGLCPLCIRSMTALYYLDWFKRLEYSNMEERYKEIQRQHPEITIEACRKEMHLVLPSGSIHKGFFAFRQMCFYIPLLWLTIPFFWFPFARTLGPKIYQFVASRRPRFQDCPTGTCSVH